MDWFIQFSLIGLLTISSLLTLYLSSPTKKKVAWICALIILATTIPSVMDKYLTIKEKHSTQQNDTGIQRILYDKLALHTHKFIGTIEHMMLYAAGGWLPKNQEEFFSERGLNLICKELNAEEEAPTTVKSNWYKYFSDAASQYKRDLNGLVESYDSYMKSSISSKIHKVESSIALSILTRIDDIYKYNKIINREYPPFLCPIATNKEGMITGEYEKFFSLLSELIDEIKTEGGRLGIERAKSWSEFNPPKEVAYLGRHRYTYSKQ